MIPLSALSWSSPPIIPEIIPDHFTWSPSPGLTYEIHFVPEDIWRPKGAQKSWKRGTWCAAIERG